MFALILATAMLAEPGAAAQTPKAVSYGAGVRKLSLEVVRKEDRLKYHNALLFSVASASRTVSLESHLPRRYPGQMTYFIDLDRLQWSIDDFNKVLEKYPYAKNDPKHPILTIRGDWLITELADTRDSDALYRLLYGGNNIPKTDDDFLKFWGVDVEKQKFPYGWVETDSQVNKARNRFVERFVTIEGRSLWRTKDAFQVKAGTDPLETLDGTFKHDGRELIVQFTKVSGKAGKRILGAAQAYLLANGEGAIAQEAPVRLVEDNRRTFGQAAIVNHASCVVCHEHGMKLPTENGLEKRLEAGVELRVFNAGRKEEVEAFHLTDVGRQLNRDVEDYEEFVRACNGLTAAENAVNFREVLDAYRAELTADDCARELGCTAEDLRLALGYAGANHIDIGSRLAGLAHGLTTTREQWEDDFLKAQQIVKVWRAGGPGTPLVRKPAPAAAVAKADPKPAGPPKPTTAFRPPQITKPSEIDKGKLPSRLIVNLPADARLFISTPGATESELPGTGLARRVYPGKRPADWRVKCTLRATLTRDGKEFVETRDAECVAGQDTEITIVFNEIESTEKRGKT